MAIFKTYNQYTNESLNEQLINEFVDPITLVFAVGAIGIAFGSDIMAAYKSRKIAKADIVELKRMLATAKAKLKKFERSGDINNASKTEEEIYRIKDQIDNISSEYTSQEKIIKDFESDKKTRKNLEEELKRLDNATLKRALSVANKEARGLK